MSTLSIVRSNDHVRPRSQPPARELDGRYRRIVETSQDAIFIVDADNRYEYLNRAAQAALDPSVGYAIGRHLSECFPAAVAVELQEELDRARQAQQATYGEKKIPFPDGPRWMGTWLVPVEDGESPATSIMGVARDITQRHDMAEMLTRQHHLFNAVIEASPVGIMLLHPRVWTCELINQTMRRFSDGRLAEGMRLPDAWPELAGLLAPTLIRALDSNGTCQIDVELPGPSDRPADKRYFSISASHLQLPDRAHASVLALVTDTTSSKLLEEQLLQAQKMEAIGRLAGGIAHDFNNLLTPIIGYTELVMNNLAEGDPRRQDLEEVHRAATSATGLARQLLTFSRKQVTQAIALDLNDVVHDAESIVRRAIGEDIDVVLSIEPQPVPVIGDRTQLEQVIMNLSVNARDAMPTGGVLTIRTADVDLTTSSQGARRVIPPGRYVTLAIADTGTGMTADVRSHLFEPFFTTKEFGKGTGLGMSIVYGIVKQSGGFIAVESAPGRGTTFTIYLPRVADTAASRAEPAATAALAPAGGETILVVEDNEGLRRLTERFLTMAGYKTLAASTARQALQVAKDFSGPIHLLLSDVIMPETDGLALARRLAVRRPDTRVLFMSGYTGADVASRGGLPANARLLQKPFTRDGLARTVAEALHVSEQVAAGV